MDPTIATPPALVRSLGLGRATAMVVGTIIGASIFVQPSEVTGAVPYGRRRAARLGDGRIAHAGRRADLRRAGLGLSRDRRRLRRTCARPSRPASDSSGAGRCSGACTPASSRRIAMVFARYAGVLRARWATSGCASSRSAPFVALSAVNYLGVRHGSALQTVVTIAKVAAIVVLIVARFLAGRAAAGPLRRRACGRALALSASSSPPSSPACSRSAAGTW